MEGLGRLPRAGVWRVSHFVHSKCTGRPRPVQRTGGPSQALRGAWHRCCGTAHGRHCRGASGPAFPRSAAARRARAHAAPLLTDRLRPVCVGRMLRNPIPKTQACAGRRWQADARAGARLQVGDLPQQLLQALRGRRGGPAVRGGRFVQRARAPRLLRFPDVLHARRRSRHGCPRRPLLRADGRERLCLALVPGPSCLKAQRLQRCPRRRLGARPITGSGAASRQRCRRSATRGAGPRAEPASPQPARMLQH